MINKSIKVLILEDQSSDMELTVYALRKQGFEPDFVCVEDRESFAKHLNVDLDLVLADYTLPSFDAPSALRILQQTGLETPFIVVTGSVSEEAAVECMKLGAADYLIKGKLARLGSAVEHALQSRDLQRAKRMAYAALRDSRAYLSAVVNTVEDGIFTFSEKGALLSTNPAFERIFGYSALECQGQPLRLFIPNSWPESDFANEAEIDAWLLKIKSSSQGMMGINKQRVAFPIEIALNKMQTESFRHFVGVVTDITDKKNLEEQIRQAQKMEAIGRLAGGIAHDFNNLLTAIVGTSEMLLQQTEQSSGSQKKVQEIIQAGERAGLLTRQLLAFSRKQVIQPIILDLNRTVHGLLDILRRIIGDQIDIHVHPTTESAFTKADPGQLEQVILNLAINARDAMPAGGIIHIEVSPVANKDCCLNGEKNQEGVVRLSVRDTGTGIDPKILPHIFEPFFTTKEMGKGTGLGLSTVFGIVQQNGGCIHVVSEAQKGTVFHVQLPRFKDPAEEKAEIYSKVE